MKVEIIDSKLVVTPVTCDEETEIYALAAAWAAYQSVRFPINGEPLRCTVDDKHESDSIHQHQATDKSPLCKRQ